MAANSQPSFLNLASLLGLPEAHLDEEFWQRAIELRVSIPVVVVSFDSVKQMVTVQPAIKESVLKSLVPTSTALPQLPNVPVMIYRGGGFSITLPLKAGDEGFVIFQDMCIDAWWQSGGTDNNQIERRRHDLSDGVFYPGGWSQPRNLNAYSSTKAQLRSDDGVTVVEVGSGTISLTPDSGTSLIKITPGEIDLTAVTVKINGASYHAHVHSGVTTGVGVTGPVTP